ncbi:Holliday junction resolvase RuvX [Thermocrinis sp.]
MKVLSIDWGSKKIGLAIGDTRLKLAIPLRPIKNGKDVFLNLLSIIKQHGVDLVLIGLPLTPSGKEGQRALEVREFAQELKKFLPEDVSIEFWDERYTTEEAYRLMVNSNAIEKREFKDSISAYVILMEFFESV